MSILVLHANISAKSPKRLPEAIGGVAANTYEDDDKNILRGKTLIFNYGVSSEITTNLPIINKFKSVLSCVDKRKTFEILSKAGCQIPKFSTDKDKVPKSWGNVVCREDASGARNQGMEIVDLEDGGVLHDAQLYTQYFYYEQEYRIIVFKGKVVARYEKKFKKSLDCLEFVLMDKKGFKEIDADCIKAANAIDIDYAGFDVLYSEEEGHKILEANTGCILTDDVLEYLVKSLKGM